MPPLRPPSALPRALPLALPLALLLGGCTGLAGNWRGDLNCISGSERMEGAALLVLEDDGGGEFQGELRVEGEVAGTAGEGELVLSWQVELEKERPTGRQTVIETITDCLVYADGRLLRETCPDLDQTWTWDGEDELTMSSDSCSLPLSR
ncbi:MAG: hypothetical protein H6742_00345 [Alphaproteobacteria bacterium]|nr:hypothetical protein [Alphaproteobacteria bacterium]